MPTFAGASAAKPPAEKDIGFFRAMGTVYRHFRKTENMALARGMFLKDGVPKLIDMGFLFPPIGWVVSIAGSLGPKQLMGWLGQRTINNVAQKYPNGLQDVQGPMARVPALQKIAQEPLSFHKQGEKALPVWQVWRNEFNEMLRQSFIIEDNISDKKAAKVKAALTKLEIPENGRISGMLKRYFLVKLEYGAKFAGKLASRLSKAPRWMFVLRLPAVAIGALTHGGLMLRVGSKLKAGKLNHWL